MKHFRSTLIVLLILLTGCTPTRVSDRVNLMVPVRWHNAPAPGTVTKPDDFIGWWKAFRDPVLDGLIADALKANQDLRIAVARVREAKAQVTVAESVLYPNIDISVAGGREKRIDRILPVPGAKGIDLTTPRADFFTGGLTARWEADVFGSNHLAAEAAAAQAQATEESRRAVLVGLLAQVATNYLELRGAQRQIAILKDNIGLQGRRLKLLHAFYRAGLSNDFDVTRQETLLHTTEGRLPELNQAAASLIHRLGVLLGDTPENLETRMGQAAPLPESLPEIPNVLPSRLLSQRPDLRRAQAEVSAEAASLGATRADLFPKFVLSASGGFGTVALGGFPSLAEGVYALGSGLTAPLFNAGRIRAQIAAADARLEQAAANYEKSFLGALEEVENAYVAYSSARERRDQFIQADSSARLAQQQADALFQSGATPFLSVLDAQRTRLSAEEELAKAQTARAVSLVFLYRAFGGGWTETPGLAHLRVSTD